MAFNNLVLVVVLSCWHFVNFQHMLHSQDDAFSGSCPRNDSVRNVWRAPFRTTNPSHLARFKICYVLYHFGDCCPRNDSVRNVWRAVARCVRAILPGLTLMPFSRRCVSCWVLVPGDVKMVLLGAYVAGCRRQPSANRIRKGWSVHVGGVALSTFVSAKPLSHTWALSARASNSDG